ncbi:acyltransferase family protein [Flavobacterium sp.]|uniref:acyltransferase family protein n=1 Tax=Flavobacterium sp. TaxID=239 RepID=UPI003528BE3D
MFFFSGCLISELFVKNKLPILRHKKIYNIIFITSLLVTLVMISQVRNGIVSLIVCSIFFAIVTQFERYHSNYFKNRIVKVLIYLGDISFSIYIFHIFFIHIWKDYFHINSLITLLLLTIFGTLLLSSITYKYIEQPFIKYSKK